MRDNCIRTKVEFYGNNVENLNFFKEKWATLLPQINENECMKCVRNEFNFCKPNLDHEITMNIQYQSERLNFEVIDEDTFFFKTKEDSEKFAKMLFFLWNSDGSTIELDYSDIYQSFTSSNKIIRPIVTLTREELGKIESGIVILFCLRPDFNDVLSDIYEIADMVDKEIGENVIFLITDLIVPNLPDREISYFYVEE